MGHGGRGCVAPRACRCRFPSRGTWVNRPTRARTRGSSEAAYADVNEGFTRLLDDAVDRGTVRSPARPRRSGPAHRCGAAADVATLRRARARAALKALACPAIGDNGVRDRPGGKATWGPPATAALRRLAATG